MTTEPVRSGWGSIAGAVVLLTTFERRVPLVTFVDGPATLREAITTVYRTAVFV
jgi:hypothetical protein